MNLTKSFQEQIKQKVSDPAFNKPIADLKKDFTTKGHIILVTRIKTKRNYDKSV
ncbi:MAG: hypothetical protein H7Z76_13475 [Methylotenera sp.]|nr:hypothetical protein [Flavobacterium sp.]